MDTTLRFYKYPSLFDRAFLAEERANWQHEQHRKVGGYDTFNCSLLIVPHKSLHEELNAGPLMDVDDLPF